jgi:hypothetical protein
MGRASEPHDLDERIGWIKESISARVSELGRRVDKVRSLTDVATLVRQHPLAAVGVTFAVGVILGKPGRSKQGHAPDGIVRAGVRSLVVTLVAQFARNAARHWLEDMHEQGRAPAHAVAPPPMSRDARDVH